MEETLLIGPLLVSVYSYSSSLILKTLSSANVTSSYSRKRNMYFRSYSLSTSEGAFSTTPYKITNISCLTYFYKTSSQNRTKGNSKSSSHCYSASAGFHLPICIFRRNSFILQMMLKVLSSLISKQCFLLMRPFKHNFEAICL